MKTVIGLFLVALGIPPSVIRSSRGPDFAENWGPTLGRLLALGIQSALALFSGLPVFSPAVARHYADASRALAFKSPAKRAI